MPISPDAMHLSGPIPGQSLTVEPGSVPWEKPPKYTTVDQVMQFFLQQFQDKDKVHHFLATMEGGAPLDNTIYTILMHGFASGLWTPSLMILCIHPLTTLLVAMLKHAKVKHIVTYSPQKGKLDSVFALVSQKTKQEEVDQKQIKEFVGDAKERAQETPINPVAINKLQKGLMAPPTPPTPNQADPSAQSPSPAGATP